MALWTPLYLRYPTDGHDFGPATTTTGCDFRLYPLAINDCHQHLRGRSLPSSPSTINAADMLILHKILLTLIYDEKKNMKIKKI
jgi:hypothetical protein